MRKWFWWAVGLVLVGAVIRLVVFGHAPGRLAARMAGRGAETAAYPEPIPNPPTVPRTDFPRQQPSLAPAVSLAGPPPTAAALRSAVRNSNIVIVVLDAARADHTGCYGYSRATTPNLDRLASQSVVFEQHFCQFPCTTPSTVCLLTGQYPDTHGVGPPTHRSVMASECQVNERTITLERMLGAAGYRTCLFSGNPAASPAVGVGTGFQYAFPPSGIRPRQLGAAAGGQRRRESVSILLEKAKEKLRASTGKPFFFYVHFLPPHNPYSARDEFKALFHDSQPPGYREGKAAFTEVSKRDRVAAPPASSVEWVNLYDANLRWADWAVGELERVLKEAGVFENTLLIITADHGEAMREHAYEWHHTCPYDEAIHIPLLIRFPGKQGPVGRATALTETVDLLPTIADLYGLAGQSSPDPASAPQGKSLVPLLTGSASRVQDYVFCRTGGPWPCYVVRNHEWALMLYSGGELRALYDLVADPDQTCNVITEHPEVAAQMAAVFEQHAKRQRRPPLEFVDPTYQPPSEPDRPGPAISEETRRELRALGYLQ